MKDMKGMIGKLSLVVLVVCMVAGLALGSVGSVGSVAFSANTVGFVRLEVPEEMALFSLPFNDIGGGAMSIDRAFGAGLPDGTMLLFYSPNGIYTVYQYVAGAGWVDLMGCPGGTNVITRGEGFWICSPYGTEVTVMGEVPGDDVLTNGVPVVTGLQLLGYSWPVAGGLGGLGAVEGDMVFMFSPGYEYLRYTCRGGGWYDDLGGAVGPVGPVVDPCRGFFYWTAGGDRTWGQLRPW